jgi:hypothetical protein
MLSAQNRARRRRTAGNSSVTFSRENGRFRGSPRKDSACLSRNLLRNMPGVEPKSVGGRSIQVWNAGAQKRSNKDEKIKCSTGDFLAGNDICHRIFGAS